MDKILATIGVVLVITLLITAAITQTIQAKHNPLSKVKKALKHLKEQGNETPTVPIITTNPLAKVRDALTAMKANLTNMTNTTIQPIPAVK